MANLIQVISLLLARFRNAITFEFDAGLALIKVREGGMQRRCLYLKAILYRRGVGCPSNQDWLPEMSVARLRLIHQSQWTASFPDWPIF